MFTNSQVKAWLLLLLAPMLTQCLEPPLQKSSPSSELDSEVNAEKKTSRLTDTAAITGLHSNACAAMKARLGQRIPDLTTSFCGAKALSEITLDDVYTKDKNGKPVLSIDEKSAEGISHLGFASPLYIDIQPVDFFEYIVTGVMKKGVGGKPMDESIKVYDFVPVPSREEFVVSTYQYKLDFSRKFGEIELKTSKLGMQMEKIYLPEEKLFIVAERSIQTIEDGLFKKWGLYIVFQAKGEGTVMWTYLDMKISNLGIHELIKDQFLSMADRVPSQFFENVSRISGE